MKAVDLRVMALASAFVRCERYRAHDYATTGAGRFYERLCDAVGGSRVAADAVISDARRYGTTVRWPSWRAGTSGCIS